MEDKKNKQQAADQQNAATGTGASSEAGGVNDTKRAHDEADRDIAEDAEFSASSPNDDLDEGETARLGEGENPLV